MATTRISRSARVRPPRAKPGVEDAATGPGRREKPATMSGLKRIPDSRQTSRHVRKSANSSHDRRTEAAPEDAPGLVIRDAVEANFRAGRIALSICRLHPRD